ncbi:MAG: epoxyqueuosine reductase [Candidatus Coatesbacteria bacterium]|nr:epoxyqueuosine reductase [Candidatus Coatesbacteria bacterium]
MSEDIRDLLLDVACRLMKEEGDGSLYRMPIMGFCDLHSPEAKKAFAEVAEWHSSPNQMLPGANSAIAIFIPFSEKIVVSNRKGKYATRDWAEAYVKTNEMAQRIGTVTALTLVACGEKASAIPPTGSFDRETFSGEWSHKLMGSLCGLGKYGLNRMLITRSGCAGRLVSVVTTHKLEISLQPAEEYCAYLRDKSCTECMSICPVGAIRADGFDAAACFEHCSRNAENFLDLSSAMVCGKCATVRCAFGPA